MARTAPRAAARTAWRADIAGVDPARLILIDESGFDTRLIRTHARALDGQRTHGTVPGERCHRLTLIGALELSGICAVMTVAAATSTATFLASVARVLIPALLRERPDGRRGHGQLGGPQSGSGVSAACILRRSGG